MQSLLYVFWAGVVAAFGFALRDCLAWPRQSAFAWERFRPAAVAILALAAAFLAVNLWRPGAAPAVFLADRSLRIAGVAVWAGVFFCGGWMSVARAGHCGLLERARRHATGLTTPSPWRALAETLAVAVGAIVFSVVLLVAVAPEPAAALGRRFGSPENLELTSGYLLLVIVLAPVWEESAFRWYLLNRLEEAWQGRRWSRPLAIAASAAFWACGHATMTDPAWVKLAQIFGVGCLLGWRFPVIGLSGCILVHLAINTLAYWLPVAF